jgi:hypothetical protein
LNVSGSGFLFAPFQKKSCQKKSLHKFSIQYVYVDGTVSVTGTPLANDQGIPEEKEGDGTYSVACGG